MKFHLAPSKPRRKTMTNQIDLLNYVCLPSAKQGLKLADGSVYGRETHTLGGAYDFVQGPDAQGDILVWRMKSSAGGPGWDCKLLTSTTLSDALTENTPLGPENFKIHNGGNGFTIGPRFLPANQENWNLQDLTPSQTNFDLYVNGKKTSSSNLGGAMQYLMGPYPIDHGGNIGVQPTIVHHWCWGANDIEENWWALNFGWLRWTAFHLTAGKWMQTQQSVHNTISPAKVPVLNFPAGNVVVVNGAIQIK